MALADAPEPAFRIDRIGFEGGAYDLTPNALTLAKLAIDGGTIDLQRQADGAINLALLFAPPETGAIARERAEAAGAGHPFQLLAKTLDRFGPERRYLRFSVKPMPRSQASKISP
jgi:hypothetical protein